MRRAIRNACENRTDRGSRKRFLSLFHRKDLAALFWPKEIINYLLNRP